MRRWMWSVVLAGLAAGAAAQVPPSPWVDAAVEEPPEVDESFWIDAVDCGMG